MMAIPHASMSVLCFLFNQQNSITDEAFSFFLFSFSFFDFIAVIRFAFSGSFFFFFW